MSRYRVAIIAAAFTLFIIMSVKIAVSGQGRREQLDSGAFDNMELAPPYAVETKMPRTIHNANLASRPISMFPEGTSEHQMASELKAHLSGIAAMHPETEVRATILMSRPLGMKEYSSLVERYNLRGGPDTEVNVERTIIAPAALTEAALGSATSSTRVISLTAWGTTSALFRLLQNTALVSMIEIHGASSP